jgi:putative transposase
MMSRQLSLGLRAAPGWGGARAGAGRPKTGNAGVSHLQRAAIDERHAQHVTLRVKKGVWNLRAKRCYRHIREAFAGSRDRGHRGFRLVHYAVQGNHVHLICEADDKAALASGINGLCVRMVKRLNPVMKRRGRMFADRYHVRALRNPTETARALAYVCTNAQKHGLIRRGQDACSSWGTSEPPTKKPRSWLLRIGWRRCAGLPKQLLTV